jgi:ADP-heptose:LPS heptosyltransferase
MNSTLEHPKLSVSNPIFLCKRRIARGDVLLTTAVVRALKARHPDSKLYYVTNYPDLLHRNPDVNPSDEYDTNIPIERVVHCDFELRYEKHPGKHIIDIFAKGAGFTESEPVPRVLYMFPDKADYTFADSRDIPARNSVAIAPGPGLWTGRNWKENNWQEVCSNLMSAGMFVVLVGSETNYVLPCNRDMRGHTPTHHSLAAIISKCSLFIGIDSFPFHVAGAMRVKRIGLFGVTHPHLIACDSSPTINIRSHKHHPMTGMRHNVPSMHRLETMARRNNPMDTITVDQVMKAICDAT